MRQAGLARSVHVKVASTHFRHAMPVSFQLNFPGMVWIWSYGRRLCCVPKAYAGEEDTRCEASQEEPVLQDKVEGDDSRGHTCRPAGLDVFHDRSHMAGPDKGQELRLR